MTLGKREVSNLKRLSVNVFHFHTSTGENKSIFYGYSHVSLFFLFIPGFDLKLHITHLFLE